MAEKKKLSKKTLAKSFRNWSYGNLTCFSQEHMQTFGYLCAMLPIVEELYDTPEEQKQALQTYSAFFNTEPQIGTMIVGVTAGLMGPLAGLGDSLIVGTLIPILLGIALGLSTGGSPLGAIFYIVVWNLLMFLGMRFAYNQGYELGGKAVGALVGPKAKALRDSIVMVGTMVIGAVGATWVSITCSPNLVLPGGGKFQDTLDGIYPHLLPMIFIIFCWYMMTKKKVNPIVMMLILVVIAFVGVLIGFFDPALSY